jgi:hypothetical protein
VVTTHDGVSKTIINVSAIVRNYNVSNISNSHKAPKLFDNYILPSLGYFISTLTNVCTLKFNTSRSLGLYQSRGKVERRMEERSANYLCLSGPEASIRNIVIFIHKLKRNSRKSPLWCDYLLKSKLKILYDIWPITF